MTPQDKERLNKMHLFAKDASSIAEGITLERLTADKAFQYSLLYPLGLIGELANNMGNDMQEAYPNIEWLIGAGSETDYSMIGFPLPVSLGCG